MRTIAEQRWALAMAVATLLSCGPMARADDALDTCKKLRIGMRLEEVSRIMHVDVKPGRNTFAISVPCNATISSDGAIDSLQISEIIKKTELTESLFQTTMDAKKTLFGDPYSFVYNVSIGYPLYGEASWNCPNGSTAYTLNMDQTQEDIVVSTAESACHE